jgi:hypothetical protein
MVYKHRNDIVLQSPIQFSLARQIPRYRPRSTQISDRLVALCLRSILLRPIHDAPFETVTTMRDVTDVTGRGTVTTPPPLPWMPDCLAIELCRRGG